MFLPHFDIRNLASAVSYLLSANFNASNHTFSNGDDVNTAASGSVQDGALTVTDSAGGTVAISSNALQGTGSGSWGTTGVFSDGILSDRGTGVLFNITANGSCISNLTFSDAAAIGQSGWTNRVSVNIPSSVVVVGAWDGAGSPSWAVSIMSASASTEYKFGMVLGGYSSAVPWDGVSAGYSEGCSFFYNDGSNWILLYRGITYDSSITLYPAQEFLTASVSSDLDNLRIPDADLSSVLEPNNLDTSVATTDTFTHISDFVLECLVTPLPSSGNLDIEFRRQDDNNKWICRIASTGTISIVEVVAGSPTTQASTATAVSNGDRVVVIADDTDIWTYVDDTATCSYASASNFSNDTGGKIVFGSGAVAHLADWARGTNGEYDSVLDSYPGAS